MSITKRDLFVLAAASAALPKLAAAAPAGGPSTAALPGVAPPRTLDELKAEVILRAQKQIYPLDGVPMEDAQAAMSALKSTDSETWAQVWIARGDLKMRQAAAAAPPAAKDLYRTAWSIYSAGRFPAPNTPLRRKAYEKSLTAYRAYVAKIQPPLEVVRIPFEGKEIVGYFRRPEGAGPHPFVLAFGGIDNLKEQVAEQGLVMLSNGFSVLAVDMPGTGEAPVKADLGSERMFSRILDWAQTRPEVDAGKMFVKGGSWGGYWATRVAIAEKDRLMGAISQGGPAVRYFTAEWQMKALGTREYLIDLFGARAAVYGVSTLDEFLAYGPKLSLANDGLIERPTTSMLVINGAKDTQVPIDDQIALLTHGDAKDAWINPKGGHMGFGGGWDRARVDGRIVVPWMQRTIAQAAKA